MTFEQYVNKLSELNQFIEGAPTLSGNELIWNIFIVLLALIILVIGWAIITTIIYGILLVLCHLLGIDKNWRKDSTEDGMWVMMIGMVLSAILFIGLMKDGNLELPLSSDRFNREMNVKFDETSRDVYNKLVEMDVDEFNQLKEANKNYKLSKEQNSEYSAVRKIISEVDVARRGK